MSVRWLREGASGERGNVLVLVAVMLFVLLGAGAMAVDVGEIMWSRGVQQNAADAAALAGVRELPENPAGAVDRAIDYAASNGFVDGVDGVTVTTIVSTILEASNATNNALTVTITRVVPPGLRAAVGAGSTTVPAQAVAVVAPAIPMCDVWPWAIEQDAMYFGEDGNIYTSDNGLPYGVKVILKVPPQNQASPGNFLAVRPLGKNEGGTSNYRESIKNGACIVSTETIWTEPGNMGNNTAKAVVDDVDSAIRQCDPCYNESSQTPDSVYWEVNESNPYPDAVTSPNTTYAFALGCPCGNDCGNTGPPDPPDDPFPGIVLPSTSRVGIITILEKDSFDNASKNTGSFEAKIVGFAAFYLIGLESDASQDFVVGAFLQKTWVKAGKPAFGGDLTGPVGAFLWR